MLLLQSQFLPDNHRKNLVKSILQQTFNITGQFKLCNRPGHKPLLGFWKQLQTKLVDPNSTQSYVPQCVIGQEQDELIDPFPSHHISASEGDILTVPLYFGYLQS